MMMLRRLASILTLVLGVMFLAPGTAHANSNCTGDLNAGCAYNDSSNGRYLQVGRDWCGTTADPGICNGSPTTFLAPDTWSPYYDTDAFYVPAGYNAVRWAGRYSYYVSATGWHKVGNAVNHRVSLILE